MINLTGWEYRFIRYDYKACNDHHYELSEVYYDNEGNIVAWTAEPLSHIYDNLEAIKTIQKHIRKAAKKNYLLQIGEKDNEKLIDSGKKIERRYTIG